MLISINLGENKISNEDLAEDFKDWKFKRFERRVGIKRRFKSDKTSLRLALEAFEQIKDKIKYSNLCLIYTTQTPEYIIPGDAHVFAGITGNDFHWKEIYQLSNGCTGFVDALILIKQMNLNNVVVVNTDTYNSIIHPLDRMNKSLFSDCASVAFVNSRVQIGNYTYINLYSDWMKISCAREQKSDELLTEYAKGSISTESFFWMNGPEIYNFAILKVLPHVQFIVDKAENEIDVIVLHQANKMMLELFKEAFEGLIAEIPILMENGNLVGCTIPNVLKSFEKKYRSKNILIVGFGVGLKISTIEIKYE